MTNKLIHDYAPQEERINALSHAFGAVLAVIATVLMLMKGSYLPFWQLFGLCVYGLSMILLFSSSCKEEFLNAEIEEDIAVNNSSMYARSFSGDSLLLDNP